MNRRSMLAIGAIGLAAQFGVLGYMIIRHELTLRHGVVCRFLTAPVDPYDAFRGRYVALALAGAELGAHYSERAFARGQRVYAVICEGTNGYNTIERFAPQAEAGAVCIRTRVEDCWEDYRHVPASTNGTTQAGQAQRSTYVPTGRYRVRCRLPFDRYYMDEKLVPEAERAYRDANSGGRQDGVAVVRVWRGQAVIEDLEVGGRPIRELARERLTR